MILIHNRRERERFLRFAVVGTLGAIVDYSVFNFLLFVIDLPLILSGVLSFFAAVSSNFVLNRYWTYPDSRSKPISQQLVQYTAVNAVGLAIRTVILVVLESALTSFLERNAFTGVLAPEVLGPNLALAAALIVVLFWNFFVNRYWTYNDIES